MRARCQNFRDALANSATYKIHFFGIIELLPLHGAPGPNCKTVVRFIFAYLGIFAYLELSGPIWGCPGLSGPICAYLGPSGPFWAYVKPVWAEPFWSSLDPIWFHLGLSGHILM